MKKNAIRLALVTLLLFAGQSVADKNAGKSGGLRGMLGGENKEGRRRQQIQDSLKELEEREKKRKKRVTLRMQLLQAGLDIAPQQFWIPQW